LVEEDVLEPWIDCGVTALSDKAAFFVTGLPEGMDCLLQPTNKKFRQTIKMDIGFSIGCNLTVMTEFYEHGNATKFKANRFNRSSTVGLAQHLSNASRRRDKQKPRWQAE
jgi:hypothetical protein